jgi:hypothetical protein
MKIRIPAHVGVDSIFIKRDRAEVAEISWGYYSGETPVVDGTAIPEQDGVWRQCKIEYPSYFQSREHDFYMFADGVWMWGGNRQGMAKIEVTYYRNGILVAFFTGNNEPYDVLLGLSLSRPPKPTDTPFAQIDKDIDFPR